MRKDKNAGLTITISKQDLEILEYLSKVYDCSKTDIIKKCLKTSTNLKRLWNEIEYNELSISDKKYYVKCVSENFYYNDNRPYELKSKDSDNGCKFVNDHLLYAPWFSKEMKDKFNFKEKNGN